MPVAKNRRTGIAFGAGLGPHSETETFKLIVEEARLMDSTWLTDAAFGIPYPESSRQKCDLRLSTAAGDLFVEGKLPDVSPRPRELGATALISKHRARRIGGGLL